MGRKMMLLSVIASMDPKNGGPAEALRNLVKEFNKRGHTHHILTGDGPDANYADKDSPNFIHQGPSLATFGYAPNMDKWLVEHICDYDAVLIHGLWQFNGLTVWKRAREVRQPYWILPHGMLDPYFNRQSRLKHLKKLVYWPIQYRILRDAVAVLFTSEEERVLARQSFKRYKVREEVISYAAGQPPRDVSDSRSAFISKFPELQNQRYILFLGRVHPKKGCDLLVKAFARTAAHEQLVLVFAGPADGRYFESLKTLIEEEGVSHRVVWTGMLLGLEKYGALKGADVFALLSHQENFGIAVAESLSCGTPVLITRPVNIWREIEHDGAGIVGDDTVEGSIQLVQQWLSLSEQDKLVMGRNARECYARRFTVEQSVTSLLTKFAAVIDVETSPAG